MKKLLIIITLFVSSFFFIFLEDAKADEIVINYNDYSLVTSQNFIKIKNASDEILPSSGYSNYLIMWYSNSNNSSLDKYYIYFFNSNQLQLYYSKKSISGVNVSQYDYFIGNVGGYSNYTYDSVNGVLELKNKYPNLILSPYITNYGYSTAYLYTLVYSSVPVIFKGHISNADIVFKYPNITYTFTSSSINEEVPTLYTVYQEYGTEQEIPAELESVTNFYTLVIEKTNYLADQITSNYILLSIIVIFIITFIFLLIFRRFL